jgi:O-antigen ligase
MKIFKSIDKEKLKNFNSYILILIAFSLPLSIALPSVLTAVLIINWLLIRDFKYDINCLKANKVVLTSLSLYIFAIIGLLWSRSIELGITYTLAKESRLLLIPIYMLFAKKEHIKYYIYAFLLAISISEVFSYAIFFHIIEPFGKATQADPTPFIGHITYNPLLAIAIYLLLYYLLFTNKLSKQQKTISSIFVITMSINMFVTGGRAGQVVYLLMLCFVIFKYFNKQKLKALILSFVAIPTIFMTLYSTSHIFHNRVNLAYENLSNINKHPNNSTAIRVNWALVSWEIIKEHPLLGIGTGSFRIAFREKNAIISPNIKNTINPHNMYIFELVEGGIVGLIFMLSIFFYQIQFAKRSSIEIVRNFGVMLPILFMIMMFSESYLLLIPTTSYSFVLFSAILYKDYDRTC